MTAPLLSAVVVHWHAEDDLARLLDAWPSDDPRLELVVVDNGSDGSLAELCCGRATLLSPGRNLGFGGGANHGAAQAHGASVLLLNPDAAPRSGAPAALLDALEQFPDAAGIAPRLVGRSGEEQCAWQLRQLPTRTELLRQALFAPGPQGPSSPPAVGTAIEQPAAAALLLRRTWWERLGGFDEGFHPAWHEDVDLALRLREAGGEIVYAPGAVFEHGLGGSVTPLGYGRFLLAYYRNLVRFTRKHHGALTAALLRLLLLKGASLRILLLPLRKPQRATSRASAFSALLALARAAVLGFPRSGP